MSRDAASMAADVETSLRNLRTGYIDLYQLHNLPEKDIEKVFGPRRRLRGPDGGQGGREDRPHRRHRPTALMRLKFWWRLRRPH